MARNPDTTRTFTKRGSVRRKQSSTGSDAARASSRKAPQQNETSDEQTITLATAHKRQPRTSQKQASQLRKSAPQRRQAKSEETRSSAPEQPVGAGPKFTAIFASTLVRNLVAAGLFSAAAALVYRKPKAFAAANESVQEAATELLDGAVDAARATSKAARKVKRKAVAAVETAGKASASATQDALTAQQDSSSRLEGSSDREVAATNTVKQRTRKRRSDAGVKRASRITTSPPAEAPTGSAPEPSSTPDDLSKMETSAFAFGTMPSQPNAEAAPVPGAAEELAEAHPS